MTSQHPARISRPHRAHLFCAIFAALTVFALVAPPARTAEKEKSRRHFAGVPLEKPDRPLSAATERLYSKWNPLGDFDNEFYTLFKYSRVTGIGKDPEVSRRDPSKVIRVDGTYYVSDATRNCLRSYFELD